MSKKIHVVAKKCSTLNKTLQGMFRLTKLLAKVRLVRIGNGETHTYNMLSLLFMVTNINVMKKNFTHLLVVG